MRFPLGPFCGQLGDAVAVSTQFGEFRLGAPYRFSGADDAAAISAVVDDAGHHRCPFDDVSHPDVEVLDRAVDRRRRDVKPGGQRAIALQDHVERLKDESEDRRDAERGYRGALSVASE